jgi:CRP-like cAMP-binding protein
MFNTKKLDRIKAQSRLIFKASFLENLSSPERYEFLQLCHRRLYKAGEYIYYQGDPGTGMYLIEDGRVELKIETVDSEKDALYAHPDSFLLQPPEAFGMLSLSHEMRRLSSAKCITDTRLLGFFRPDLVRLQDRHPKIAIKLHVMLNILLTSQLQATIDGLAKVSGHKHAYWLILEQFYSTAAGENDDQVI